MVPKCNKFLEVVDGKTARDVKLENPSWVHAIEYGATDLGEQSLANYRLPYNPPVCYLMQTHATKHESTSLADMDTLEGTRAAPTHSHWSTEPMDRAPTDEQSKFTRAANKTEKPRLAPQTEYRCRRDEVSNPERGDQSNTVKNLVTDVHSVSLTGHRGAAWPVV